MGQNVTKRQARHLRSREKDNARSRAYYLNHKDDPEFKHQRREYKTTWKRQRGVKPRRHRMMTRKEYAQSWYKTNKDRIKARRRERYLENINEHLLKTSRWKKDNPEKCREYNRRRTWSKRSIDWNIVIEKWNRCDQLCYICGFEISINEISADHVIPSSKGGLDHIGNIMPAHKVCNCRKHARLDYPVARPDLIARANG